MLAYAPSGAVTNRYRWQVRHEWDMGEGTDTTALLEINKLSDRNIVKDYFYNEYQELGAVPDNYITFITQKPSYSTKFLIRKRVDDFLDVVDRLPEFSITVPDNNFIKNTPFYYKMNSSAVYLNHEFDNTNTPTQQKDLGTGRIDTYNQLSYAMKFFRSLSVTPYAAVEDTYYSKLAGGGNTNEVRNIFSAGINNSVKFYRVYDVQTNFLDLNINKLRHVITPTANYYYTHSPTISPSKLYQFDAIDALDKQNGILFGLENRLQTKRLVSGEMKSVDLATLQINTNYMFRLQKGSLAFKHDKFDGVNFKLEIIPYSWAYLQAEMTTDPKSGKMQNGSIDLVSRGGDKWSLDLGNRYENVQTGTNNLLGLDGTYMINEKWKIRIYERYNTTKAAFEEQEFTFTRDLHCWLAEFTYSIANNGGQNLWLIFKLKAFPQTPIGLKQTYSRPRFGEAGAH